jgi:hypothetical protein
MTEQWKKDRDEMVAHLQDAGTDLAVARAAWDTATDLMLDPENSDMFDSITDEMEVHEKAQRLLNMIETRWREAAARALADEEKGT